MQAPQEALVHAVAQWCRQNCVATLFALYEADQRYVELQNAGLVDSTLVSSIDSDLLLYGGGRECPYFYEPVERRCYWIKMFEHVLVEARGRSPCSRCYMLQGLDVRPAPCPQPYVWSRLLGKHQGLQTEGR